MRRITWILAAALVALGVALWLGRGGGSSIDRGRIRNVVLISLDTTRADRLGCYGFSRDTTPNIDAVAAAGVLFEHAIAPTPLTLPSHTSMLTGAIPPHHGVRDNLFLGLGAGTDTLAAALRRQGFSTGAVVSTIVLHRIYGLDRGFDMYLDRFAGAGGIERRADEATRLAIEWIETRGDDPFFLFLHYYDPHFEYDPPEPFASRFADDPYAGEIAFADAGVGRVIETLRAAGLYDSTLLVITADHGEMLGEHDERTHGYFIYQPAIRVPLIVRVPGLQTPRRVPAPAGLVDIAPTICSLLGVEPPADCRGADLSPLLLGDPAPGDRSLYCESLTPTKYDANGLYGLVGERWKLIRTTRPELYDLAGDPDERRDVLDDHPQVAARLDALLAERLDQAAGAADDIALDATTLDRLRSLGYVGGSVVDRTAIDESLADPKDLVALHTRLSDLERLTAAGRLDEAAGIGRTLLEEHGDLAAVQYHAGVVAMRQRRPDDAARHFERALELDEDHFLAAKDLAGIQAASGRVDQAIESYRRAIAIRPNEPLVHFNLARLYHQRGETGSAARHLEESARLNPEVPTVQSALATVYLELGRFDDAVERYRAAVELAPDDPLTLEAMASALAASGDFAAAIEASEKALSLHQARSDAARARETRRRLELYRAGQLKRDD